MATGGDNDSTKRSVVVDEEAFEEQFLRCTICREKFEQEERAPKSLPCNHTFCMPCLKQVFEMHQQATRRAFAWADDTLEGILKCPSCRVEIYISRSGIGALPSDHRVIQMMDFFSKAVTKAHNICPKHENQPLNFFCKLCLIPICRDCTVLDHKEQQGHVIADVSQTLDEFSVDFDTVQSRGKTVMSKLKENSDDLANASKRLDLLERELRSKIKDTFIEYRLLLERRQEAMISQMRDMIQEQKSKINTAFVKVCEQGNDMQKQLDTFSQARSSKDVKQLFKLHQKAKDAEASSEEVLQNINPDDMFISFDFEVETEGQFLADMSGLGELTSHEDSALKIPLQPHQLVTLERREGPSPRYANECDDVVLDDNNSNNSEEDNDLMVDRETERLLERAAVIATAERLAQRAAAAVAQAQQATGAVVSRTGRPRRSQSYRVVRHPQNMRQSPQDTRQSPQGTRQSPQSTRQGEYSSSRYSSRHDMDES